MPANTDDDQIKVLSLVEVIRRRPGMFLGGLGFDGLINMLCELLDDLLIEIQNKGTIQFELDEHDNISIYITDTDVQKTYERFERVENIFAFGSLGSGVLIAVCEHVTIRANNNGKATLLTAKKGEYKLDTATADEEPDSISITFHTDPDIFRPFKLSYAHLNDVLMRYAYLNPEIKIISVADQQEYQRNVYAFKRGIAEQLDALIYDEPNVSLAPRLDLETTIGNYAYQISLVDNWVGFRKSSILSYSNNKETPLHGSLVDGVLLGIIDVVKREAAERNVKIRISKKSAAKMLIIIAVVKGPDMSFNGAMKWRLDAPNINKDIRAYIAGQWAAHFKAHPDQAEKWLYRLAVDQPE